MVLCTIYLKTIFVNTLVSLCFSAAVMMTPFCRTPNGIELQFGTNYIGHVLLTYLLMDKLRTSGTRANCARIINISSHVHYVGKLGNLRDTINR